MQHSKFRCYLIKRSSAFLGFTKTYQVWSRIYCFIILLSIYRWIFKANLVILTYKLSFFKVKPIVKLILNVDLCLDFWKKNFKEFSEKSKLKWKPSRLSCWRVLTVKCSSELLAASASLLLTMPWVDFRYIQSFQTALVLLLPLKNDFFGLNLSSRYILNH